MEMFRLTSKDHALLTEPVLVRLKKNALILNFMESASDSLAKQTGLTYPQICEIKEAIVNNLTKTQKQTFSQLSKHQNVTLPSGIENLDNLLGEGFKTGSMYELCGLSSSGKSQICMTLASNVIKSGENVFYIDTKRDLAIQRILSNLDSKNCENLPSALEKLEIARPGTLYDLITTLHDFIENKKAPLIIIDSLAALALQHFSDTTHNLGLLSNVKSLLEYIKEEIHVAIVVVNFVVWADGEDTKHNIPALGRFWLHAPETRLHIGRLGGNGVVLTVTKSSSLEIGKSAIVTITESGVL